jgi:hypothetical protein
VAVVMTMVAAAWVVWIFNPSPLLHSPLPLVGEGQGEGDVRKMFKKNPALCGVFLFRPRDVRSPTLWLLLHPSTHDVFSGAAAQSASSFSFCFYPCDTAPPFYAFDCIPCSGVVGCVFGLL